MKTILTHDKKWFPNINSTDLPNIYIVTVLTPTDSHVRPLLTTMIKASEIIAEFLKKRDIVIKESIEYLGVTKEIIVSVLEWVGRLSYNEEFNYCN